MENEVDLYKSQDEVDDYYDLGLIKDFFTRNKKIIASFVGATFLLSISYLAVKKPVWKGEFQIVLGTKKASLPQGIPAEILSNPAVENILNMSGDVSMEIFTEIEILKSPSVLLPVFNYVKDYKKKTGIDVEDWKFLPWSEYNLEIKKRKKTSVLTISYIDNDKNLIFNVLNNISKAYQKYSLSDRNKGIEKAILYLQDQIEIYGKESLDSNRKVLDFAFENDLTIPGSKDLVVSNKANRVESAPSSNFDRGVSLANKIRQLDEKIKFVSLSSNNSDELYNLSKLLMKKNKYINRIEKIDAEIGYLKSNLTSENSLLKSAIRKRNTYFELLRSDLKTFLIASKNDAYLDLLGSKRPKEILIKYRELLRKSSQDQITLSKLEAQSRFLSLEKAKIKDPWELITKPTILTKPISPNKPKVLLFGILSGSFLGIAYSVIKNKIKGLIYKNNDVTQYYQTKNFLSLKDRSLDMSKDLINLFSIKLKEFKYSGDFVLIKIGNISDKDIKILNKYMSNSLSPKNLIIKDSLLNSLEYPNKILVVEFGLTSHSELREFFNQLNIYSGNLAGIIALNRSK